MNCKSVRNKLIFFIDKELSSDEEKVIEAHLKSCNDCLTALDKLKIANSIIEEEKKIQVNPFFKELLINNYKLPYKTNEYQPSFNKILKPVYITAIFVAAVFIGIHIGNKINEKSELTLTSLNQKEITANTNTLIINETDDDFIIEH